MTDKTQHFARSESGSFAAPIHFVVPGTAPELLDRLVRYGVDAHWRVFCMGPENWCLQAFAILRRQGVDVSCSERFRRDAVNVAHVSSIAPFSAPYDAFVVGVQADYLPHPSAQIHIVQNQSQVSETCFWLPHWLQPGLIPRDSSRTGLRTVGYAGQDYYLAGGRGRWENECRRLGLEFRMLSAENWHDFSSIDAVLAIRTFDHYEYDKKPPTKLFNAWHVGTPLVAGNDSAFRQVGIPGADYLVANSFEEAVSAIERLRDDGDLYRQIVEAGRRQALTFARERIAEAWIVFFQSIAIPRFEKWKEGNQGSRGRWIFVNSERLARTCFREARRKVLGPIGFKR